MTYSPSNGIEPLRNAIRLRTKENRNLDYADDQMTVGCGAKQIIHNDFQVALEEGDEVIVPARYWASYSSVVKFLIKPLVTLWACHLFGLEGKAAIAALLFQALLTASSSYIMARQLGGDAPLMAGIIACQTLLAAVALPAVITVRTQWV